MRKQNVQIEMANQQITSRKSLIANNITLPLFRHEKELRHMCRFNHLAVEIRPRRCAHPGRDPTRSSALV